jgi:hypothetical protein
MDFTLSRARVNKSKKWKMTIAGWLMAKNILKILRSLWYLDSFKSSTRKGKIGFKMFQGIWIIMG